VGGAWYTEHSLNRNIAPNQCIRSDGPNPSLYRRPLLYLQTVSALGWPSAHKLRIHCLSVRASSKFNVTHVPLHVCLCVCVCVCVFVCVFSTDSVKAQLRVKDNQQHEWLHDATYDQYWRPSVHE
jgi:hypothetical protein